MWINPELPALPGCRLKAKPGTRPLLSQTSTYCFARPGSTFELSTPSQRLFLYTRRLSLNRNHRTTIQLYLTGPVTVRNVGNFYPGPVGRQKVSPLAYPEDSDQTATKNPSIAERLLRLGGHLDQDCQYSFSFVTDKPVRDDSSAFLHWLLTPLSPKLPLH